MKIRIPGIKHRHRYVIYGLLAVLVLVGAGLLYEVESDTFKELSKSFLESMCDRRIEIGAASVNSFGWVTLRDVRIYNRDGYRSELVLHAPKIRLVMGMTGGETSSFRPTSIEIESPRIWFERPREGKWNTDEFWVKKPPRRDHPTFNLPITVNNAEIFLADSTVGMNGIALNFRKVEIDHTVMSDGLEITNSTIVRRGPLPGGGFFDLDLRTHPNAGKADATIRFKDASIVPFRPYCEFLTMFDFQSGIANGTYKLHFRRGGLGSEADLAVTRAMIRHPKSGTEFKDVSTHISYANDITETRVTLRDLSVEWYGSHITGNGVFSTRRSPDSHVSLVFKAEKARGEDLAFLLCDPLLDAVGPVQGEYRVTRGAEDLHDQYRADVEMTAADVKYGSILQKAGGTKGGFVITGTTDAGIDAIEVSIANSIGKLTPKSGGWRLELVRLHGADVARHFTAFSRLDDFSIDGTLIGALDFAAQGSVNGTIDFSSARLDLGKGFSKPAGEHGRVTIAGRFGGDRAEGKNCMLEIGKSRVGISGVWTPSSSDLQLNLASLFWSDARKYLPSVMERFGKTVLEGSVAGSVAFATGQEAVLPVECDLDLTASRIEIPGFGHKAQGLPAGVGVKGEIIGTTAEIRSGYVRVEGTRLGLTGRIAPEGYTLSMMAARTPLDGLRTILASQIWSGLRDVQITGTGDVDVALVSTGDALKVAADLDAERARIAYADTWLKKPGEIFLVRTRVTQSSSGSEVERLEFTHGTSTLACDGKIGAGRPASLEAGMRANIDVPTFLRGAPGLERMIVSNRKASDALKLIADSNNRAELNWKLSGTIEEPKVSLMMDQIMRRAAVNAISRQLKNITGFIIAPLRVGGGLIGGMLGGAEDTRAAEAPAP